VGFTEQPLGAFGHPVSASVKSVPTSGRDTYFFNGGTNTGSSIVPTTSYSSSAYRGKAAASGVAAANGSAIMSMPIISRAPYDTTKTTMICEWKVAITSPPAFAWTVDDSYFWFQYGFAVSVTSVANAKRRGWGIQIRTGGALWFHANDDSGGVTTAANTGLVINGAGFALSVWHTFKVTVSETAYTLWCDGVQVATIAIGWPINGTETAGTPTLVWSLIQDTNVGNTQIAITEWSVTYDT
jgi:hypothetical protein